METQTRQQTLQEFYDSLPDRAEKISPVERYMLATYSGNNREEAEKRYSSVMDYRKATEKWKREHVNKRDTLKEIINIEYGVSRGEDPDEAAAEDYQYSFKPIHALKYAMKYHYRLDDAIAYAKRTGLGKREFRAAARSLLSDQQRIHDYIEKSNAELGGEGSVTTTNSCLRNTGLFDYHLHWNDSPPERIFEAIYHIQFESHKKSLEIAKSLIQKFEELDGDKK